MDFLDRAIDREDSAERVAGDRARIASISWMFFQPGPNRKSGIAMNDLTDEKHAKTSRRGSHRPMPNLGSMLAVAISLFALAIGAYQTRLMQNQARVSVWPFLSIGYNYSNDTDTNGFIWRIDNNGVGPAKVETVALTLDDKPMRHWSDVFAALGATAQTNFSNTTIDGDVILPNVNRETTIEAIRIHQRDVAKLFHDAKARFRMDICYCSVYDECWIAHWEQTHVDPVANCAAKVAVPFED
jgi:hypothetical protein